MKNIHREDEFLHIGSIQEGKAQTAAEHHYRAPEGLGTIRVKGKVRTGTGAVVPAEDIQGQCQSCKAYETMVKRCCVCGAVLCPACAREAHGKEFCGPHYAHHLETFNTWAG